jgi:DNA-binding Lrp family transcriptional regulator
MCAGLSEVGVEGGAAVEADGALDQFERAVVVFDEVVEARKMLGNPDCFLRIVVSGIEEYEQFQMQKLTALPAVFQADSHRIMKLLED